MYPLLFLLWLTFEDPYSSPSDWYKNTASDMRLPQNMWILFTRITGETKTKEMTSDFHLKVLEFFTYAMIAFHLLNLASEPREYVL